MTEAGDETVDPMFDEIKTVSVRTVNGKRFVADEETIREMEFAEACDALVVAETRFGKIDRITNVQL